MKIKTNLITLVLLLSVNIGFSQSAKQQIESNFNTYLNSFSKKDFRTSLDFIADDFFKIISKEQMLSLLERTFNSPDVNFEIKDAKIIHIGDIEKIGNKHYSLLLYSNNLLMKFNRDKDEKDDERKQRLVITKESLEQSFGEQNVKLNEVDEVFEIYSKKQACAISPDGTNNWKFVVMEKQQKRFLEKILPKELLKNL